MKNKLLSLRILLVRMLASLVKPGCTDNNLAKDERQALKRRKNDENIVIHPADKGRVTVVMDSTDYYDKMDPLVTDKLRSYEEVTKLNEARSQHFNETSTADDI